MGFLYFTIFFRFFVYMTPTWQTVHVVVVEPKQLCLIYWSQNSVQIKNDVLYKC